MPIAFRSDPRLIPILACQSGVATRAQLVDLGLGYDELRAHLKAARWSRWGDHVIILHNGPVTRRQLMWAATLDAGPTAALCSHTALELAGFTTFASEAAAVHLLIGRGAKVTELGGLVVHESRRVLPDSHIRIEGLRCTPAARSALDAAAWQPWPRFACALLAAVVQQRLCTADDLEAALAIVGRVRHKAHMREAIRDIAGGSEALGEIDLVRLCDRYGLQRPVQQVKRRDRDGRWRYLDGLWRLPDGGRVVLEVDGSHHMDVAHWQDDIRRERSAVIEGARVLRATSIEVRVEPGRIAADLEAMGIPRVVRS